MPEQINQRSVFSLTEVAGSIKRTLAQRYTSIFWVKAEMNRLNHYSYTGHCYPELVEKVEGKVVAQVRANLWKPDYLRINALFLQKLREPLRDGINILFSASIQFDAVHGLSLRIHDIDPVFSLGELERERLESIERLKKEGIFDKNKRIQFPLLPQRIAVISVETSKGYADFLKMIEANPFGFRFFIHLFPALLQGDRSVDTIIRQLRRIKHVQQHFDLVAIIRGGGGEVGLSSYNNYQLAREIALCPLPVLTGIGHSTNETVSEMVSYRNSITPTELGDFLLRCFQQLMEPVEKSRLSLKNNVPRLLREKNLSLEYTVQRFSGSSVNLIARHHRILENSVRTIQQQSLFLLKRNQSILREQPLRIKVSATRFFSMQARDVEQAQERLKKEFTGLLQKELHSMENLADRVRLLDPINILRRGYSITLHEGKALLNTHGLNEGDLIQTLTAAGKIISRVENIQNEESGNV